MIVYPTISCQCPANASHVGRGVETSIAFQSCGNAITFLPPEVLSVLARSLLSLLVDLERLLLSLSLERGESDGLALLLCFEESVRNRQQPW